MNKNDERAASACIKRVSDMEQAMNTSAAEIAALFAALERYREILPMIAELKEYYQSPLWLEDFDNDCAGKLPVDLRRGVLSQDGLHDLLSENERLKRLMTDLAK